MANHNPFKVTALAAAIAAAGAMSPAYALFNYEEGDLQIQLDTTVSVGAGWRISDRDYRSVGDANAAAAGETDAHYHGTSSQDNGNLAWKKGSTYSEVVKITADLEMNYKNFGAFIRGKAFYDNRLVNGDGRTDIPAFYDPAEPAQSNGTGGDILDAFVWGDFDLNGMPLNVRLGRQVISWGESVLFSNGINTINPIDVNAFLTPGSEVKDALLPLTAAYASLGVTENLSLEAFVLLEWKETELPGCGTYFSTTDLVGPNCWSGFYASGTEYGSLYSSPSLPFDLPSSAVALPRGDTDEADDDGQFGVAARYFAPSIETEFGLYYINYHSQAPIISGHAPDLSKIQPGDPITSLTATPPSVLATLPLTTVRGAFTTTNPLGTALLLPYADYFAEYPEDIQLFGASFNTTMDMGLPGGATAVAGEISMRKDQPFQLEDGDTLGGALGLPSLSCWDAPVAYDCYSKYEQGEYSRGYVLEDYYQAEISFIHFFEQVLGASRWTVLLDIAGSYLNLPDKDKALLNSSYNATLFHPWAADNLVGTGALAPVFGGAGSVPYPTLLNALSTVVGANAANFEDSDYYPTSGAWGYKMRFTGEYNNVFAGVNLRPTISFSHDVYGVTPGPITNFIQNRKALGLSLEAEYLNTYTVSIGYTDFYGAEPYNQLADRDFATISASASF